MGASSWRGADRRLHRLACQRSSDQQGWWRPWRPEVTGLREQFHAGGAERLAAIAAQRASQPGSQPLSAGGRRGRKAAGNLIAYLPSSTPRGKAPSSKYVRAGDGATGAARHAVGVDAVGSGRARAQSSAATSRTCTGFAGTWAAGLWSVIAAQRSRSAPAWPSAAACAPHRSHFTETSRTIVAGDLTKRIRSTAPRRARPPCRDLKCHARPHRGADGGPARRYPTTSPRPQDAAHPVC